MFSLFPLILLLPCQAFDPPLDLSEDVDIAAHAPHDKPHDPLLSSNRDSLPSRTVATSQDRCLSEGSKAGCGKQSNAAQSSERIARTVVYQKVNCLLPFFYVCRFH